MWVTWANSWECNCLVANASPAPQFARLFSTDGVAAPTRSISETKMQRLSKVRQRDLSSGKGLRGMPLWMIFATQSLRINLTSVLGQVSGKQTIWDSIWLGVLSETMPVREGRRQQGAERGAELSCSLNKELSQFLWGFSWAGRPCRVTVLRSRESVLYIHTGPDLVLGLPLEREHQVSQVALVVKNMPAHAGDVRGAGSIPGSGRSPGWGHGNPLQYCHLENPMGRGIWWATVHKVTKSWTQLSDLSCVRA